MLAIRGVHTDFVAENWMNIPTNSIVTVHNQDVFVEDIMDQYVRKDPWHRRSAGFVHSKGLAANEKTATPSALPGPAVVVTESSEGRDVIPKRAHFGPTIPFSLMRSATPQITPQISRTTTPDSARDNAAPSRGRATISGSTVPTHSDVRSIKISSEARPGLPSQAPSQGNIKKKRMSLSDLPQGQVPMNNEIETASPLSPIERVGYGDPAKIARFFPELTLTQ